MIRPREKHEYNSPYDNSQNNIHPKLIIREESQIEGNSLEEKYNNLTVDMDQIFQPLTNSVKSHGSIANGFRIENNKFDWLSWQLFWKWTSPLDKYDYTFDDGLFTACCLQKKLIYKVVF